jgi:uncharacterized protein (TIGR02265 family)
LDEPNVGGNIIYGRHAYVVERGGAELWKRVLARLSKDDQAALAKVILVTAAYPLSLNIRLDQAIAAELSPTDPDAAFLEMGRASADANLGGVQRAFVHEGDPQFLLSMAEMIYAYYYAQGRRDYRRTGPTSGVLTTYDAAATTPGDCLTVIGWYQRAIERSGGREVSVVETRCRHRGHPVCEYQCSWAI